MLKQGKLRAGGQNHQGLKAIALIKVLRGSLALTIGLFLLQLQSSPANFEMAKEFIKLKTQDPSLIFLINYLGNVNENIILGIAIITTTLGVIRYMEAIGLWFEKRWAEWLALLTSMAYIPFEVFHLAKGLNFFIVFLLAINITICIYLIRILQLKESQ